MLFRKEILIARELDQVNHIKDILAENDVKYYVTTNSITNAGRHHGVPFINSSAALQYRRDPRQLLLHDVLRAPLLMLWFDIF